MKSILSRPYPFLSNSFLAAIFKVLLVGSFACFFLYHFDNAGEPFWFFVTECTIISLCQVTCLYIFPKAIIKSHNLSQVPVWQYIIYLLVFVLVGYTAAYIYLYGCFYHDPLSFRTFICFLKGERPTGFLIVFVVVCLDYIFLLKQELITIRVINDKIIAHKPDIRYSFHTMPEDLESSAEIKQLPEPYFIFNDEAQKMMLNIQKAKILFVKSADNYIEVFYRKEGSLVGKQLIRNKLSVVELDEQNDFLMRVHRSYLCNLENVVKIGGNSKGYILHFADLDETVSVSRSKSEDVLEKLNQLFKN